MVFVFCLQEKQTNQTNKQIKPSLEWLKVLSLVIETVKTGFFCESNLSEKYPSKSDH